MLLASIGGSVQSENEYGCCDVCSPDLLFDERLDVLQLSTVSKRKRRRAVRNVGDDLKQKLISVREEVYKERSSLALLVFVSCVPTQLLISVKKLSTLKALKIQYY